MKNYNYKSLWILALFFLLIASNSYAELSDSISEGFLRINEFFESEQYLAYSKTIDFLFFSLLFISVYLIGVKYAFKQVSRPEKLIAVILGLMSAFLMTANHYSIIDLLPYTSTFLYIFLFVIFWLILKGIQSKFLRFIVALLLTLAAILIAENLIYTSPDELFQTFTISAIFFKNDA